MKNLKIILMFSAWLWTVCPMAQAQTNEEKEENPMKEVCEFLKRCGVYYLATTEGDQPRVRPFGTAAIFENRLYIQTDKRKNVAKQMLINPKIEICAYDSATEEWLRVAATVVPDERREVKAFMLDEYPSLKSMYSPDDDNTLVLYLTDATATFYSFANEPVEVKF
ncbi:MAG: pyridoxamine 5'-phosphate oxidase family protein [Candidatus Azobacteroides sp.]|nr:pyridoxamine 5'-phosphate oxidase family protein [Candidatus Azobacteroides sp.]